MVNFRGGRHPHFPLLDLPLKPTCLNSLDKLISSQRQVFHHFLEISLLILSHQRQTPDQYSPWKEMVKLISTKHAPLKGHSGIMFGESGDTFQIRNILHWFGSNIIKTIKELKQNCKKKHVYFWQNYLLHGILLEIGKFTRGSKLHVHIEVNQFNCVEWMFKLYLLHVHIHS